MLRVVVFNNSIGQSENVSLNNRIGFKTFFSQIQNIINYSKATNFIICFFY